MLVRILEKWGIMAESKEREYAKHVLEMMGGGIRELKEKLKKLEGQERSLSSWYYGRLSIFVCPLEKSNKDAICPECENALPEISEGYDGENRVLHFLFPHGMSKEMTERQSHLKKGCRAWKKKEPGVACGCGGTESCICGYKYDFCNLTGNGECPFCGRELKIVRSGMVVAMSDSLKIF